MFKKLLLPIAVIAAVGFATKAQAQSCTGSMTVTIDGSGTGLALSATSAVTSDYNGSQISCNLASQGVNNDGVITVTAGGGTTPYEYSKDGGTTWQSSNVFSGLTAGPYTITVRDASLCTKTTTSTIIAPPAISAGTCLLAEDGCQLNAGSIKVDAVGGTGTLNATWTAVNNSPFTGTPGGSPAGTTPTVVPVTYTGLSGNSTYHFYVTDANGCVAQ